MFTTIKWIFDHGQIILSEEPLVNTKSDVMITFLPPVEEKNVNANPKIVLGMLEGKIKLSDDFNEPLEDLKDYM